VFGTLQDRLVKELRLAGISTVEAANAWLPRFVEDFRSRTDRKLSLPVISGSATRGIRSDLHRAL
jgi:hypothetical protein